MGARQDEAVMQFILLLTTIAKGTRLSVCDTCKSAQGVTD